MSDTLHSLAEAMPYVEAMTTHLRRDRPDTDKPSLTFSPTMEESRRV
jgi:hypothetical protein